MRKSFFFFAVFFLLIAIPFSVVIIKKASLSKIYLVSPLPEVFALPFNKEVSTLALWYPSAEVLGGKLSVPAVTATSALLYDLSSDKAIYMKNSEERLPMASLTKIMTAVVALEHQKADDRYTVYKEDLVGEDSMGLTEGETLTLEELLYGMMLHSGNDAAEVLASNYQGGRAHFIKAMNNKAKSLGMENTHFTNPTGLEGDGDQYTTARDLLVLTRYVLKGFPLFQKVAATATITIQENNNHKSYYLENETNLLTTYPGVKGVKTGYTPEAGLCLVTYLDYDGRSIVGILLNSENRRDEMKELLDYGLKKLGVTPPKHG